MGLKLLCTVTISEFWLFGRDENSENSIKYILVSIVDKFDKIIMTEMYQKTTFQIRARPDWAYECPERTGPDTKIFPAAVIQFLYLRSLEIIAQCQVLFIMHFCNWDRGLTYKYLNRQAKIDRQV